MYRAIAWKALQHHIPLGDAVAIVTMARDTRLHVQCDHENFQVSIDGVDVTHAIRTLEVSEATSKISTIPALREEMVVRQRRLGAEGGVVMEGRDIGTIVFPHADFKIFLEATPEARAERRYTQDLTQGKTGNLERTIAAVQQRDRRDASRTVSPMVAAPDAIHLDTTQLNVDQVVEKILELVGASRANPRRS